MLRALGGGCQVPMGAVCHVDGEDLTLRGAVVGPDGTRRIEASGRGSAADAEGVGRRVAEELLARGAREMF
jgi:hydroxymethylbilane synthase